MRHGPSLRPPTLWIVAALACSLALAVAGWSPGSAVSAAAERSSLSLQTRGLATVRTVDGQTVELYEQSHALVIGMSKYQSGWRQLPGVETDVVAVREALQAHGFTVRVERDLTREAFDRTLREFISTHAMNPRHRILIYFAGHGHTQPASDGRQLGFVVPVDAPLPTKEPTAFRSRAISMDQIEVYAREIESRHALMVFDSCFSGTLFDVTRALPGAVASNLELPVRQFITAGSAGQEVPDTSEFRRQFVAGLKGEADLTNDGYISGTELGLFLEDKVASYTRQAQTPKFGKIRDGRLDKGDIMFQSPSWTPESRLSRTPTMAAPTSSGPDDVAHWEAIKDSRDRSLFEEHLKRFPQSRFKTVAERRLDELVREDPVATASRWFTAVQARDVKSAYALLTDPIRQNVPQSAFAASLPRGTAGPDRQLLYDERFEGKAALIIFVAGDEYQRVSLVREGTKWSVFFYRWLPRAQAVPAEGPPFRNAAIEYLDLVDAKRPADAYARWAAAARAGLTEAQFTALVSEYMAGGRPSRELVYAEQETSVSAVVILRTRRTDATWFERVSFLLENNRWMVSSWMISPAPSS